MNSAVDKHIFVCSQSSTDLLKANKNKVSATKKLLTIVSVVVVFAFIAFVTYGVLTDCPDTAGYVYCGFED